MSYLNFWTIKKTFRITFLKFLCNKPKNGMTKCKYFPMWKHICLDFLWILGYIEWENLPPNLLLTFGLWCPLTVLCLEFLSEIFLPGTHWCPLTSKWKCCGPSSPPVLGRCILLRLSWSFICICIDPTSSLMRSYCIGSNSWNITVLPLLRSDGQTSRFVNSFYNSTSFICDIFLDVKNASRTLFIDLLPTVFLSGWFSSGIAKSWTCPRPGFASKTNDSH